MLHSQPGPGGEDPGSPAPGLGPHDFAQQCDCAVCMPVQASPPLHISSAWAPLQTNFSGEMLA